MGYVQESRMPHWSWHVAVLFLTVMATLMTAWWTPAAAIMYVWPVYLYLVGWGQVQERNVRPSRRGS